MQCKICGEEVDNSEELAKHMERMHPIAEPEPEPEETSKPPEEDDVPPPPIIPPRM